MKKRCISKLQKHLGSRSFRAGQANQIGGQYANAVYAKSARQPATPITIKQMYDTSRANPRDVILSTSAFLKKEVPIRLAKQIIALDSLSYNLSQSPEVRRVNELNKIAFNQISTAPEPSNLDNCNILLKIFQEILDGHYLVVPFLNIAVHKSPFPTEDLVKCPFLNAFLCSYFHRRIGIRTIMAQYSKFVIQYENGELNPEMVGEIQLNCKISEIIESVVADTKNLCLNVYGFAPDVHIIDKQKHNFTYNPRHLSILTTEIIRNSLRATCEYRGKSNIDLYPIKVVICDGDEPHDDITIKVSDLGGGILREEETNVFHCGYTTGKPDIETIQESLDSLMNDPSNLERADKLHDVLSTSMVRLGYGLPLARLYTRYFGGDLELFSMDGHGTDCFIYLKLLSKNYQPKPDMDFARDHHHQWS